MDDEPHSEEFSFPKIIQDEEGDASMNLSRSIWLPYCSTISSTGATAASAAVVSECCTFPTCPHNREVATHLISAATKEEEHRVKEGRTPRSSAPTTPKTSVKLPRSPTTTSPRSVSPMDSMWEDQNDGSVTPSRRRRSLLSGAATPKSFTAEDLAEERMDMLWEEYHEHDELVKMGIMCQFLKKHWLDDDDDDTDEEDVDDDDGESSPYTGSHSSSSSTVTSATNNTGSTPEMMSQLCYAQVLQMSESGSPATAVVPLRKPGLRVILKVLKKLFLLHFQHHRTSRSKRSSSKVRSSSPAVEY